MRTFWKWFFGILIALVVVAALVGVGYLAFTQWRGGSWMMNPRAAAPDERSWENMPWRNMPWHDMPWRDMPGRDMPGRNFRMPMRPFGHLPGIRFGYFSPVSLIFGGLIRLGLLALVVVGIVLLIRAAWRPKPAAVAAPATVPATASVSASEVQAAEAVETCSNCGAPVQSGWQYCPACGTAQST